jgi:hypothetical protein
MLNIESLLSKQLLSTNKDSIELIKNNNDHKQSRRQIKSSTPTQSDGTQIKVEPQNPTTMIPYDLQPPFRLMVTPDPDGVLHANY